MASLSLQDPSFRHIVYARGCAASWLGAVVEVFSLDAGGRGLFVH